MRTLVQKYGGTSVGSVERIERVADRIVEQHRQGNRIVVVLSAMGKSTDQLVQMALQVAPSPDPREYDMLLSSGEQVSTALLAMALISRGLQAKSYTGWQVGLLTDSVHGKARIQRIDTRLLERDLDAGAVAVVAGFQGMDEHGQITTLGRGGSDTSAVAIAVALRADECQIFTDVDGIYTADPRICPEARRLERINFDEMIEMSSMGAQVLQIRAVALAGRYNMPLRVMPSLSEGEGTIIYYGDEACLMEEVLISAIVHSSDEAQLTIKGVPDRPGVAHAILQPIADANIEVDMIAQSIGAEVTDMTFTVHRNDYAKSKHLLDGVGRELAAASVAGNEGVAKISVVGIGMRSHSGLASQVFDVLAKAGINIQVISTSEIKISVLVYDKDMQRGVQMLHKYFKLDQPFVVKQDDTPRE